MKRLLLGIFIFLGTGIALSAAPPQFAFRISFSDKLGAPQLSASPTWLSQRSMERRAHFKISLDSTDRPVSPLYLDTVLREASALLHTTSRWLNNCVVLVEDSSKMQLLRSKRYISSIEWVGYFSNGLHQRPASSEAGPVSKISGSPSYYGLTWLQTSMVNGDYIHDMGFKGAGKLIVLMDGGFTGADLHPGLSRLWDEGRLLETHDFCRNDGSFAGGSDHGLSCLSTIVGYDSGNYVGTAPEASIALYVTEDLKFLDSKYELDNLIAGIERADSIGADVISVSLGYMRFSSPFIDSILKSQMDGHTTAEARVVNMAVRKGIFYVSIAGNEGGNVSNLLSPGDADSALTIGSVNNNKSVTSFSSPGPNAAGKVKPELCLFGNRPAVFTAPVQVSALPGTSFAAPQAAGYVACLLQAFPDASLFQIRQAMIQSADSFLNPSNKRGYGVPDMRKVFSQLSATSPVAYPQLKVYPNPFKDYMLLNLPEPAARVECSLYDMMGRNIPVQIQQKGTELKIEPFDKLPSGIYVIRLSIKGTTSAIRVFHE